MGTFSGDSAAPLSSRTIVGSWSWLREHEYMVSASDSASLSSTRSPGLNVPASPSLPFSVSITLTSQPSKSFLPSALARWVSMRTVKRGP